MVIYEVNLIINNEIYSDYYAWLVLHIKEMLTFRGFREAKMQKDSAIHHDGKTRLTVCYTLDARASLDDYLSNHAPAMRADGISKFGDKFSATRRIFSIEKLLVSESCHTIIPPLEGPGCSDNALHVFM